MTDRERIEADLADYRRRGGRVTEVPFGVSGRKPRRPGPQPFKLRGTPPSQKD